MFPARFGFGYKWATVKLHEGAGKAYCSVFTKTRDGHFLAGSHGDIARQLEISHPSVWGWVSWSAARTFRHEEIQILFRKNPAASLVSGSFGFPPPCFVWFSSHLLRVGYTDSVFRVLAVSITAGGNTRCWFIVPANYMAVLGII